MERKLGVGETLSESFSIYRDQAGVLLPVAFWLFLVVAIFNGLAGDDFALISLAGVAGLVVGTLYEGIVVSLVRDLRDGRRDRSIGELVRTVVPVMGTLLLAGVLYGVGLFFGFILLVLPGLYLLTIWAVISPAIVVERRGVSDAFGRSRQLVRGSARAVFCVVVIAEAITVVTAIVLTGAAESLADGPLIRIVFGALASTVAAPVSGLVVAVLYFRLLEIEVRQPVAETPTAPEVPEAPAS